MGQPVTCLNPSIKTIPTQAGSSRHAHKDFSMNNLNLPSLGLLPYSVGCELHSTKVACLSCGFSKEASFKGTKLRICLATSNGLAV